jgi:NAD(P)-dependent dehydrogenase (short-subunit alcohol dehydrogenase family)
MNPCLQNKVLLITGSTGIAAATARLASAEGATLFVVGIDEPSVRKLAAELNCGSQVTDLTKAAAVEEAVAKCISLNNRIDGLFNVAGISGRRFGDGPLHECTEEGWDQTIEVNLKSLYLMSRAVLRVMLEQELDDDGIRGSILQMGTVSVLSPDSRHFATHAYAASKSAIHGLTAAMASYYLSHKIRVNAIAPGLTRTPMSQRAQGNAELLEYMRGKQPLCDRMLEPADIADAAVFLLGKRARRITGEILSVDAGWRWS